MGTSDEILCAVMADPLQSAHPSGAVSPLPSPSRSGTPIPDVAYSADEVATWNAVLERLADLLPAHACREYLRCLPLFNFRKGHVGDAPVPRTLAPTCPL